MNALEAALLIAAVTLPIHFLIQWQLGLLSDPRYWRSRGVILSRDELCERCGEVIGHLRGVPIHAFVTFMGMEYRFERVVRAEYRERIGERQLLLEPGLLYLTD
jgi:hypothetical protein